MPVKQIHPVVCYGEALWTILPTGKQAGGSPVRIASHLQRLGLNPAVVSRIGFDDLGKEMIEVLESEQICTDYFQMDEDKLTGVATAYVREGYETIYTIYNDVAWDVIACTDELPALAAEADYFVYGSLAARCRESCSTLRQLLTVAKTKVLHLHLCAPFYSRSIVEELLMQADIVVMTGTELELITGWFSNYKEETDRVYALQQKFSIPVAGVVNGQEGFILAANEALYKRKRFGAPFINDGAGSEAFLSGLILKLSSGGTPEDALVYAAAIASVADDTTGLSGYHKKSTADLPYINRTYKD